MEKIGNKIEYSEDESKFVILGTNGNIEKHPKNVKVHEFSSGFGIYIYELLFENGNKEFYIENKGLVDGIVQEDYEGLVEHLDRMDNSEEFQMTVLDVYYKKNGKWYIYLHEDDEKDCIVKRPCFRTRVKYK